MKQVLGFNLIELVVVVFIIAVLAAISYPTYQHIVIKVRRSDAQSELTKAQITQSSYHIFHPTYLLDTELVGLPLNNEFYEFSVVAVSNNNYLMKAEIRVNTSQAHDQISCQTLFIDQNNNKTSDGILDNSECWQD